MLNQLENGMRYMTEPLHACRGPYHNLLSNNSNIYRIGYLFFLCKIPKACNMFCRKIYEVIKFQYELPGFENIINGVKSLLHNKHINRH